MDAQILDADCVQVGVPRNPRWLRKLRNNEESYLQISGPKEFHRRNNSRQADVAFVVRIWCRTASGESLCLVVADPWSTSYRKLRPGGNLEIFAKAVREELNDLSKTGGGMVETEVVFRHSTNGFHPAKDGSLETSPWLRVRVASQHLRMSVAKTLEKLSAEFPCIILPVVTAETRVEVHSRGDLAYGLSRSRACERDMAPAGQVL